MFVSASSYLIFRNVSLLVFDLVGYRSGQLHHLFGLLVRVDNHSEKSHCIAEHDLNTGLISMIVIFKGLVHYFLFFL